jgi:hypothetical protein
MLLKAAIFLLPSSLLGWLLNHSVQLICGNMSLQSFFRFYLNSIAGKALQFDCGSNESLNTKQKFCSGLSAHLLLGLRPIKYFLELVGLVQNDELLVIHLPEGVQEFAQRLAGGPRLIRIEEQEDHV